MSLYIRVPDVYLRAVADEIDRRIKNPNFHGSPAVQRMATPCELAWAYEIGGDQHTQNLIELWENGVWNPKFDVKHPNKQIYYDLKTTLAVPGNFMIKNVHADVVYILCRPFSGDSEFEVLGWAQSPRHKYEPNSLIQGTYTFNIFNQESYRSIPR